MSFTYGYMTAYWSGSGECSGSNSAYQIEQDFCQGLSNLGNQVGIFHCDGDTVDSSWTLTMYADGDSPACAGPVRRVYNGANACDCIPFDERGYYVGLKYDCSNPVTMNPNPVCSSSSSSSSSGSSAAIIGGVVGGVGALVIIALLVYLYFAGYLCASAASGAVSSSFSAGAGSAGGAKGGAEDVELASSSNPTNPTAPPAGR